MNILSNRLVVAKKEYSCDACMLFLSVLGIDELEPGEQEIMKRAEEERYKILPGHKYRRVVYVDDGLRTFRARPEVDSLCDKLGLYED